MVTQCTWPLSCYQRGPTTVPLVFSFFGHRFDKPADIFSAGITILDIGCDVVLPARGPAHKLLRTGRATCLTTAMTVSQAISLPIC